MFVYIGNMRNWLSTFVNDETGTVLVRELVNALVSNYLDYFCSSIVLSYLSKLPVNELTELDGVLIEMQKNKISFGSIGNLPDILIPTDFINLSILDLFGLGLELCHSVSIESLGKLIIKVQIILKFFKLVLVLRTENILDFVRLLMLLLHLLLLLVECRLFLVGKVVTVLDLKVEPLCCDFVGHCLFYWELL